MKSQAFYAGAKAHELWVSQKQFADDEGYAEAAARLCPHQPTTPEHDDRTDGFERAHEAYDTEHHVDPSQCSYEELDEWTRHNPETEA